MRAVCGYQTGLLGDVEVDLDGRRIDIGPARPRCVLAALLLAANTPVPVEQLIDRVWADRAPQQVRVSLQSHLTRLRGALAATDAQIVRRGGGYLLAADNPHKTTVAAYSLRGREHPTVSTPLTWAEVRACQRAEMLTFTAEDVLKRVDEMGDVLAGVVDARAPVPSPPSGPSSRQ